MAFVALFYLPDSPDQARYLTEEEKEVAKVRAIRQVGTEGAERIGSISFNDAGLALLDIKNWLAAVNYDPDKLDVPLLILFLYSLCSSP
jgi:hypothetical protein